MTRVTWEKYEPIPIGEYPVEITSVEAGTSQFIDEDTGKLKEQLTWKMVVSGGDYDGEKLITWTSISASLKSNLAKYAKACGFDIQAAQEFDIADLVGHKCLAVVLVRDKDDGTKDNKVMELKPIKQGPGAVNSDGRVEWSCSACGDTFMLTPEQLAIGKAFGGKCKACFNKPAAPAKEHDPFETNPLPVEA